MSKTIRALMATGAELHWHYDPTEGCYVVRIFGKKQSKEARIDREKVTGAGNAAAKLDKDLALEIYQTGEVRHG